MTNSKNYTAYPPLFRENVERTWSHHILGWKLLIGSRYRDPNINSPFAIFNTSILAPNLKMNNFDEFWPKMGLKVSKYGFSKRTVYIWDPVEDPQPAANHLGHLMSRRPCPISQQCRHAEEEVFWACTSQIFSSAQIIRGLVKWENSAAKGYAMLQCCCGRLFFILWRHLMTSSSRFPRHCDDG